MNFRELDVPERRAPALHVTHELFLRARNPEAHRFVLERFFVIAVIEHLEPSFAQPRGSAFFDATRFSRHRYAATNASAQLEKSN